MSYSWGMSLLQFDMTEYALHFISFIWYWYLQAEPPPQITWLKDDEPVSPWINIINTEGMSQLVIPSSKRTDSAIYTIKAKNSVGEASFDIEVRVTGKDKLQGFTLWLAQKSYENSSDKWYLCTATTGGNYFVPIWTILRSLNEEFMSWKWGIHFIACIVFLWPEENIIYIITGQQLDII